MLPVYRCIISGYVKLVGVRLSQQVKLAHGGAYFVSIYTGVNKLRNGIIIQ